MKVLGLEMEIRDVYEPSEDSLLLAESVEKKSAGEVLDMGTGSGIQALVASKRAESVTGADINKNAVEVAKENAKKKQNI